MIDMNLLNLLAMLNHDTQTNNCKKTCRSRVPFSDWPTVRQIFLFIDSQATCQIEVRGSSGSCSKRRSKERFGLFYLLFIPRHCYLILVAGFLRRQSWNWLWMYSGWRLVCWMLTSPRLARVLILLSFDSRRGITTFSEIRLMLSHPEFVHVPLPNKRPSQLPSERRSRGRKKTDGKENLLHTHVIPLFQQRGLIAETFSMTYDSWEGIVRLPGPQSEWNSRAERISAIAHVEGLYRKMTIQ